MLPSKEFQSIEDSDSAVLRVREHVSNSTERKEAGQCRGSEDSDSSNNGFDDDEEGATPLKPGSPIDWTAGKGPDYLVAFCKRELPTGEGHRHLISSLGFAADLVDRAIQELGEGIEYEMLLEYLLYLTSQQDPTASTPASRVKRASTVKKPLKEFAVPIKRQVTYNKQVCTVEKLMDEYGYPPKAVEPAVIICGTPLWKAAEVQVADVVDFLASHNAELNESEGKARIDEDAREDTDCSRLRQLLEENESISKRGKRKVDSVGVSRRKSIVRLSSQSNVKREHFDQLPLNSLRIANTMPKVKLVPSQQRYTPVCRIGRPRMLSLGVSITVARHEGSVGFGLPGNPVQPRYLDEDVVNAPFFYFENVASMPNDEWDRIRRHLFDIEPEFVDSLHFSACRRPRGYIHNLPIDGRRKILADPPMTIQDLLPHTKPFWPAWDPRTKLNCITTRMGSEFLIKKLHIREGTALQTAEPSPELQREILQLCRHWNLVWTSPNIPTPIDEIEIEAMLGFDAGHSRNILSNRSRYKALGNSFSVHTVAFHFSVLKPLYPDGVKVLSLFSGIGGAEVALHKMGIKLLVVVSVEIDDGTRRCLEAWWATSKQTGVLNQNYHNIKDLGRAQISELVNTYGGFDLIVGGTPCNNLSGSNHVTRVGLDGKQSTVFFEFSRVVTAVRDLTIRLQRKI